MSKTTFRLRRFIIILFLATVMTAMIIFAGFLALWQHPSYTDWIGFCVVTIPVIVGAVGAWIGIESGKMRGGRLD